MYLRWFVDLKPSSESRNKKVSEIIQRNKEARLNVLQLRRKLRELEREAEKLGIVIESSQKLQPDDEDFKEALDVNNGKLKQMTVSSATREGKEEKFDHMAADRTIIHNNNDSHSPINSSTSLQSVPPGPA